MRYESDFERWQRSGGDWSARRRRPAFTGGRSGYDRAFTGNPGRRYGGDYWWMGERAMPESNFVGRYDEAYRRFSERTHPAYSPIGAMQPGGGPGYRPRRSPLHERENSRFSDWTRWF